MYLLLFLLSSLTGVTAACTDIFILSVRSKRVALEYRNLFSNAWKSSSLSSKDFTRNLRSIDLYDEFLYFLYNKF